MEIEGKNFYEILGVERDAPKDQIKESYKELARIFHPDSHYFDDIVEGAGATTTGPSAHQMAVFKAITEAYNTLCNETRRSEYDKSLPGLTPDWDEDVKEDFKVDQRLKQHQSPDFQAPFAWGSFGKVEDEANHLNQGAADFDEQVYRPVSQILRQQRSILGRLLAALKLD